MRSPATALTHFSLSLLIVVASATALGCAQQAGAPRASQPQRPSGAAALAQMFNQMGRDDPKEAARAFNQASEKDVKEAARRLNEGSARTVQELMASGPAPTLLVSGILLDPDGVPVARTEVGVWSIRTGGTGVERNPATTTDSSGAFRLEIDVAALVRDRQERMGHLYWNVPIAGLDFGPSVEDSRGAAITFRLTVETRGVDLGTLRVRPRRTIDRPTDIETLGPAKVIKGGGDDAEMVLVPAGDFWMGSTRDETDRAVANCKARRWSDNCPSLYEHEFPRHRVVLDAFYIDRHEVTSALFERFVRATAYRTTAERLGSGLSWQPKDSKWQWERINGADWRRPSGGISASHPDHPVVQVSWNDAVAYCTWARKRLPTEAEWEKAARGNGVRRYPWGADSDTSKANGAMRVSTTTPVGSYSAGVSPYGAHDMAGNASEWVADWYDKDYYAQSPERNPPGPGEGKLKLMRGESWTSAALEVTFRTAHTPDSRGNTTGFRCARALP